MDPPRKRAVDVNLQAPRASYGSHRSRVARRGKRKSNRSRVVQKADQVCLVLGSARAEFSKPPEPIVSPVLKMGSLKKHREVVTTEPIGAGNTSVSRRYKAFPVVAGELALCRPDTHWAVEAVGSSVLVRRAGPITQDVGVGEVEVHLPHPGTFREFRLAWLL